MAFVKSTKKGKVGYWGGGQASSEKEMMTRGAEGGKARHDVSWGLINTKKKTVTHSLKKSPRRGRGNRQLPSVKRVVEGLLRTAWPETPVRF